MNPLHATRRTQTRTTNVRGRSGLSIIEVLTSIVVAMIGVFGVMILIPFAVKQAQVGLDSDAAVMLARNAYTQFEIGGYRNPNNWAVFDTAVGGEVAYSPFTGWDSDGNGTLDQAPMLPRIFTIDPLGISENGAPGILAAHAASRFPYTRLDGGTPFPDAGTIAPAAKGDLRFIPANLGTPAGVTMADFNVDGFVDEEGRAIARRMFRSSDDLVFGEAVDDFWGPEQYFDQDSATPQPNAIRRQSNGRLSWSAIVVPFKDDPLMTDTTRWSYKMYILVYKDRKTAIPSVDANDQMLTAMLDPTLNTGSASPVSNVFLEAGVSVEPTTDVDGVQRDDWVMLVNRTLNEDDDPPRAGVVLAEKGFDRQVAFYRVVSASNGDTVTPNASLTLDGPDFNFGSPTTVASDPFSIIEETFVVHLKDVVGVYERTFTPEDSSNWTL